MRTCIHLLWREKVEITLPVWFPFELGPGRARLRQEVLSVILKQFPVPSTKVPLSELISFKRDDETQFMLANLWNWIRTTASGKFDRVELQEEIEWKLKQYKYHLSQLAKDSKLRQLSTLFATPADILEDLVKLRWGKAARRLFQIGREEISAHREELKLPGHELAFIHRATKFSRKKE